MSRPIYLDNNSTTPLDRRVLDAMMPYLTSEYGNASSRSHAFGWAADEAVTVAREQTAAVFDGDPESVVFTSGATEAINHGLKGACQALSHKGKHVIVSAAEHKAVLDVADRLERDGFEITRLPVDRHGLVERDALESAIRDDTIVVAAIWANNETGVIQPMEDLRRVTHDKGCLLLADATQAVGKIPLSAEYADLIAISAHKFYGPKGVGALCIQRSRRTARLRPLIDGGGQQGGRRGGTLNTPGIVGLGAAAALAVAEMAAESTRLSGLRDRLEQSIQTAIPSVRVNGDGAQRLPQTTNLLFPGLRADKLMSGMRELAVSAGSACSSGSGKPSHVLKAIGLSDAEAASSIRFGLGRFTREEEVERAATIVTETVQEAWNSSPS